MERAKYCLDTHILVWIYSEQFSKIPNSVIKKIEFSDLYISPFVELELEYLYEIERLEDSSQTIIEKLKEFLDLQILETSFSKVIKESKNISWTRDVFDRIIVANSISENIPIITADRKILEHFSGAVWK